MDETRPNKGIARLSDEEISVKVCTTSGTLLNKYTAEAARRIRAANARIAELEQRWQVERQTGGPCCVCAGSGKLLTDEPCGVCSGSGEGHQERHGLRVLAQAGEKRIADLARDLLAAQARIAELEQLVARVSDDRQTIHIHNLDLAARLSDLQRANAELEATIARVSDLCQALFIETDDMMADVSKHAKASALIEVRMRIESALDTPGKP